MAPEVCLRDSELEKVLFLIRGPEDSPYQGGRYVLEMRLPPAYPMEPPTLRMLTPSGRFEVGAKICTSFTAFHPESWVPIYTFSTIVVSFVSFMTDEDGAGIGSIRSSPDVRRKLAADSAGYNLARGYTHVFREFRGSVPGNN